MAGVKVRNLCLPSYYGLVGLPPAPPPAAGGAIVGDRLGMATSASAAADQLQALGLRRRGRPRKHAVAAAEAPGSLVSLMEEEEAGGEYERERAARIRENMERMQKLGILDLAHTLAQSAAARRRWRRKPLDPGSARVDKPAAPAAPLRRSLRLAPALADQPAAPGRRKRGRPRKHPAAADQLAAAMGPRKRGRPRKHPAAAEQLPAAAAAAAMVPRKRGRPRKHAVAVEGPAAEARRRRGGAGPDAEIRAERIREDMERMQMLGAPLQCQSPLQERLKEEVC